MKLINLKEGKSLKDYEKEWETLKGYKTCDNCGTRLNDGGTCPKCDDGEEDYGDELKESAASDGWVKSDKSGKQVSTNSTGMTLINHSDKGLNADVFHWSVVDADGETLLDTGKLYYGYDVSHSWAKNSGRWIRKAIYGDAIILKCIADKYNFNDEDILAALNPGIDNRYRAACGISHDVPGWQNAQQIVSEAESANIIDKFTVKESNLTESVSGKYVAQKCDSDIAEEIALMAMRAMRLKEHEAQALEYDLIEGKADKWVKDFEALPDNSEVKKLFFTFVKKSTNESYDPKDFNIDASTPFDDEMEKIYKPLATAIKEERWEDAAKEYWELKNQFDAELQSVSKKPIIGKLFKLLAIPHNNALNNYKKSIPAEYLEKEGKKNESLSESMYYVDEIVPTQGGKTETERHSFNTLEALKQYVKDANLTPDDIKSCGGCDLKDLYENLVKDTYYDSLATNEPKIYLPTDKGNKVEVSIGADKLDEDDWDISVEVRDNGDYCFAIPENRLADELGEIHNPKLTRLTYERADELCEQIRSYFENIDQDDIYDTLINKLGCNKTKVEKFWNAPDMNESLVGSLDNDEDGMNELFDIKVDAKGFGGSGNNVHVGPGSIPLTSSLKKSNSKVKKDYDDDFDLTVY